jgi:heterodisulfide reductase subunit A
MKTAVYFCNCGPSIGAKVDGEKIATELGKSAKAGYYQAVDFLCSQEGKEFLEQDIRENTPERVVIAACSPREHEGTFMGVLAKAGMNPYLMQLVNVREHIAWVTDNREKATEKTIRSISAAVNRVAWHEPLDILEVDVCPDVLVIGAGPAGLKAALIIAQSGRRVVIVEKTPVIGGLPVRFEEIFPAMECGPCLLEPVQDELLHGDYAANIEMLTMAEVVDLTGFYGNFNVKIQQKPRFVEIEKCVGCGECVEVCPIAVKNEFNYGLDSRKAIAFPFAGALPYVPFIHSTACLRNKGESCNLCQEACPVEETIIFHDRERMIERKVGAIVVATGGEIYDCHSIPQLGYSRLPDVYNSLEFERIVASNGNSFGEIKCTGGSEPEVVAIIHCVGSLDQDHLEYCSGVCCGYAFKFNHIIAQKLPQAKVYHFFKEIAIAGKEEFAIYQVAKANPHASFIRYQKIADLAVARQGDKNVLQFKDAAGQAGEIAADMIILCPAVVPGDDAGKLGTILEIARDKFGFFEELQGRIDSAQSKVKGIYLAGTCQAPMDLQQATNQGLAAAAYILSGLVPDRKLTIQPVNAVVDDTKCSGCRVCLQVCPYQAIALKSSKDAAEINQVLCQGCGTCAAACPAAAIKANYFTNEEILAEIEGVLASGGSKT